MNSLGKYRNFIILLLLAILILWFFGRSLDWAEVWNSLKKANLWLVLAATLIICVGYLLRAKRWQVLLSPITETSLSELFATTTVGFAAIFFVGRAGEIVRPMWLSMRDQRVRPSAGFVTLFLERILDLACLITFFSLNLIWFNAPVGHEKDFSYIKFAGILLLAGVVSGIIALMIYQKLSPRIIAWLEQQKFLQNKIGQIFIGLFKQLATALLVLRDLREVLSLIFWTLTLWLAIAVPTWLVLLAFNLPLSFTDSLFIMGFAAVSSVVPTPGGAAGAFHTATAASLIFLNIDREVVVATAIVMHLVYFFPAVFFGFYYFLHGDITWERIRSLLSAERSEDVETQNTKEKNLTQSA